MLTAIATSKSTVLGLRLDHDRRAWVEAAAAQAGVTVRGFFESLIDRARLEASGERAAPRGPLPSYEDEHEAEPDGEHDGGPATGEGADVGTAARRVAGYRDDLHAPVLPPLADVPRLLLVPGQVLEAATSATATLIESGGRCVRDTWRAFLVTLLEGMHDRDA